MKKIENERTRKGENEGEKQQAGIQRKRELTKKERGGNDKKERSAKSKRKGKERDE